MPGTVWTCEAASKEMRPKAARAPDSLVLDDTYTGSFGLGFAILPASRLRDGGSRPLHDLPAGVPSPFRRAVAAIAYELRIGRQGQIGVRGPGVLELAVVVLRNQHRRPGAAAIHACGDPVQARLVAAVVAEEHDQREAMLEEATYRALKRLLERVGRDADRAGLPHVAAGRVDRALGDVGDNGSDQGI